MLTKLWLKNVKNIDEISLEIKPKTVYFICGENNQGKSNFLDALMTGLTGSSVLTEIENMICFDKNEAILGLDYEINCNKKRVYIKIENGKKTIYQINNVKNKNKEALTKQFNSHYISADVIRIFQESPEQRRKTLDQAISILEPNYKDKLARYIAIMRHRNSILKLETTKKEDLIIWNQQLIEYSFELMTMRKKYLNKFTQELIMLKKLFIDEKKTELKVRYNMKNMAPEELMKSDYQSLLNQKLTANYQKERILGYTSTGIHRDDFEWLINNQSLFKVYSRGINRSFAILFKVIVAKLNENKKEQKPIFCLDDIFCELDMKRKKNIAAFIEKDSQVFYTSTVSMEKKIFNKIIQLNIKKGKISNAS